MTEVVTQNFFVFYLAVLLAMATFAYFVSYYFYRKVKLAGLFSLPSIVVNGPSGAEKERFVRVFADHYLTQHPVKNRFKISRLVHGKKMLQFVMVPDRIRGGLLAKEVRELMEMNLTAFIHIVDMSSKKPMEEQTAIIDRVSGWFDGKRHVIVADNVDRKNASDLRELKRKYKEVVPLYPNDERSAERMRAIINQMFSTA